MLTEEVTYLDMKRIEEINWRHFELLKFFSYRKGNQKKMNALSIGKTPLVSAKKIENGYKGFYSVVQDEIFNGHCITLNNDGDGGAGLAFYQPASFALDTHVTALYPLVPMTKYVMLFIASCISKQRILFGHGRSINTTRLNHLNIMLPCSDNQSPDYAFMEKYMKQKEKKLLTKYKDYLHMRGQIFLNGGETKECQWKEFDIKEVFTNIVRGRRLKTDDHIAGSMPYVSSSAIDNGVDDFVSNNEGVRIFSQCLTIANSGSVGATFYHPYSFVASDHVTSLANDKMNKYVYLFISTIAKGMSGNYSFNREIKDSRIQREKIMLPITDDNRPDYDYMGSYMRKVEYRLLNRYIDKRLKQLNEE